jgi:Holliday junction resolvasome RuvABC endonuclease subunit
MTFLAIDQSLNHTGYCIFDDNGVLLDNGVFEPKTKNIERVFEIKQFLKNKITQYDIKSIAIEGYSFMSGMRSLTGLAELGGMIKLLAYDQTIPVTIIPPTVLKRFITGKGVGKKELVLLNVYKKFGFDVDNNNIADAYVLGQILLYIHGHHNPKVTKQMCQTVDTWYKKYQIGVGDEQNI